MLLHRRVVDVAYLKDIAGSKEKFIDIYCNKIEINFNFSLHYILPDFLTHGTHFVDRVKLNLIDQIVQNRFH